MLDMGKRVARARAIALGAAGVAMLMTIAETGWVGPGLFLIAVVNMATLEPRIRRARRPERVVASSLLLMTGLVGAWAAVTGGGDSPVLVLVVIPVAMTAARFHARVV
jgi:4-hydroxybenzoate polyprenyltransferase